MKKKYVISKKLIAGLLFLVAMLNAKAYTEQPRLTTILTSHQWTLVENIETVDGASINIDDFNATCEKDNILVFKVDSTYQIIEGGLKCNSTENDIKGEGWWIIDEQNKILTTQYGDGNKIDKTIVTITDEMFKLQYTGEGKKTITLTYISEQGMKKEEYKSITIPESKASKKIVELLNAYLEETKHYRVIHKKDIEPNMGVQTNKYDTARTSVLLWPLSDKYDTSNPDVRKNELLSLAKKNRLRYIITGHIIDLKTYNDKDRIKGKLDIQINILDAINGKEYNNTYYGQGGNITTENAAPRNGPWLNRIIRNAEGIINTVGVTGIWLQKQTLMQTYWKALATKDFLDRKDNEVQMFFSKSVTSQERKKIYDSAMAINEALSDISVGLIPFTAINMAYEIKVNHVEGSGKDTKLAIEAGNDIRLFKNELLQLVKLEHINKDGKLVTSYTVIGDIIVESLSPGQANMAYCIDINKKSKVIKTYIEAPNKEDYIVRTMLQPPAKE